MRTLDEAGTPTALGKRLLSAVAVGALVAGAFVLAPGAAPDATAQEIKKGGILRMARPEEPNTLVPWKTNENGAIWAIEQFCDALLEPDEIGYGLRPAIAESWEVSDDELVYTFKIRDAKFSNGEPVTMDDILFSLDEAAGPDSNMAFVFPPMTREAVDEKTLRITLEEPFAPLLSVLSLFATSIVHKATFEADPQKFAVAPVCAGAFKVDSFEHGSKLVLSVNEYYWDRRADGSPAPYVDGIEMLYVPESNTRMLGLRNGDYDIVSVVPLNQASSVEDNPDLALEVSPAFRLDYVYLNHSVKPIDNRDIRMAMTLSVDREAIKKVAYFGLGEVPNSFMPIINFHCEGVAVIAYDLERAKELVAGAYDGTPIELVIGAGEATDRQVAQMLQQGWQAAGLNVNIVELDGGTAFARIEEGDYQATLSYITSDTNDQDFLATLEADSTVLDAFFTRYRNDEVSGWLTEARQTTDPKVRQDLYCKVQEQVHLQDAYSVAINFRPFVNAYANYVKGFRNLVTGPWWLKDVWLDK